MEDKQHKVIAADLRHYADQLDPPPAKLVIPAGNLTLQQAFAAIGVLIPGSTYDVRIICNYHEWAKETKVEFESYLHRNGTCEIIRGNSLEDLVAKVEAHVNPVVVTIQQASELVAAAEVPVDPFV